MGKRFRELLAEDKVVRVFAAGRVIHPVVFDLFGLAGQYDGLWLDQEHGGLTYQQILQACVAARANGFDTFVRMSPIDYSLATQNLEAGAGGLMAAQINSAEQAEEFVRWSKFAPRGVRGMNTSGWDGHYTHKTQAQFAEDANRDVFLAIQIETLGGLEDAEKIAAIDGVDLLFVGPSDLSQSMGHVGQLNHEDVWKGMDRVAAACKKHGKHWGTVPADPDYARRAVEKGCRMLTLGSDVVCLRRGIAAVQKAYGEFF